MNIKCVTINTHGLRDSAKRSNIFLWLQHFQPDVVFLQETHLAQGDKNTLKSHWDGPIFIAPGGTHSSGVVSLFSKRLNLKAISNSIDPSGRYLNSIVETDDGRVQLCNIYAPNQVSHRKMLFENLAVTF